MPARVVRRADWRSELQQEHWRFRSDATRAIEHLSGLIQGIALDAEVTADEVAALTAWFDLHPEMTQVQPFTELADRIALFLADGHLDQDEREELLECCERFVQSGGLPSDDATAAIRRLHGVLHGIVADGAVTEQEAIDLADWLEGYQDFARVWPFCTLVEILQRIRADGQIDDEERAQLARFAEDFAENTAGVFDERRPASLVSICQIPEFLQLAGARVCFTGTAELPRVMLRGSPCRQANAAALP